MPKYQIVRDRVKLSDERFDHYLDEALSFFSGLESIAGSPPPNALTDTRELMQWRDERWKDFREAIENCRHKIQAINYSISLIDSEMRNPPIQRGRSLPIHLDETEFLDDVILFEFESFLFQIYSSLDVFVHLLRLFYPSLDSDKEHLIGFNGGKDANGNGRAGKKTVDLLKTKDPQMADYIDKQVDAWIQKVYDLRNTVTHKSKVRDLQMFLVDKEGLHMPKLSEETDLLVYCRETYENLKTFIFYIEQSFLLVKAGSFYEKK